MNNDEYHEWISYDKCKCNLLFNHIFYIRFLNEEECLLKTDTSPFFVPLYNVINIT